MNKKIMCYAGVVFLLLFVGSSSALIDLTGTYQGSGSSYWDRVGTTLYPTTNNDDVQVNGTITVTDDIIVTDDIYVQDKIYHRGDTDTYFDFAIADSIAWYIGGVSFFSMAQLDAGQDGVLGNPRGSAEHDGSDIDFAWIQKDTGTTIFYIDAFDGRIGVNTLAPDQVFDVRGNTNITGDLNVTGNIIGNIHYAEAWYHNHPGVTITFGVQDYFYNLSFNDTVLNGFTCVDDENLTCVVAGLYLVNFQASGSGQNNHEYICCVGINGVCQNNTSVHKKLNSGGDIVIMAGTGFVQLSVGDKVTLMIKDWKGTGTGTYHTSNLNLVRIGS